MPGGIHGLVASVAPEERARRDASRSLCDTLHMLSFLRRLRAASSWGASLALLGGCGSDALEPAPAPACRGEIYDDPASFGFHGQCCDKLLCRPPLANICPAAEDANPPGMPEGSGECLCEGGVRGPFANQDPHAEDGCCYLVAIIGCDGRPFVVDGAARVAPVTRGRSDWSSATDLLAPFELTGLEEGDKREVAAAWIE